VQRALLSRGGKADDNRLGQRGTFGKPKRRVVDIDALARDGDKFAEV
jgi:hypothetical protein